MRGGCIFRLTPNKNTRLLTTGRKRDFGWQRLKPWNKKKKNRHTE